MASIGDGRSGAALDPTDAPAGGDLLLRRAPTRGVRTLAVRPTSARSVIEAAAELVRWPIHHQLSVSTEPAMVDGVRHELHWLVFYLMENALRHTPPGTLRACGRQRDGDQVVIEVADHRPGRPARLGPPRVRAVRAQRRRRRQGLRSGLAIVRWVAAVTRPHGRARAAADGIGTRFVIRLPARPAPPTASISTARRPGYRASRRVGRSDLDDDRQDHRPAAQAVVDERRQVVVQLLLEQVDALDAACAEALSERSTS